MVEAGVGIVVAAAVKAAATVVKIVNCYATVGQVGAEAQPVIDWQGCFIKRLSLTELPRNRGEGI